MLEDAAGGGALPAAPAEDPEPAAPAASSSSAAPAEPAPPKEKSVTKGKQAGRDKWSSIMKKSANALHAVTRIICDRNTAIFMDMACYFTEPWSDDHSETSSTIKGPEVVGQYFAQMAAGEWEKPMREAVRRLGNGGQLAKFGFVTEFPNHKRTLDPQNDELVVQDSLAFSAFRLVSHLLTEWAITMAWHRDCCPGLIAGLEAESEDVRKQTMKLWKTHWDAYSACRHNANSILHKMIRRSNMSSPSMLSAARIARAADWEVTPKVQEVSTVFFQGIGHTLMNERGNQSIRDAEVRDNPHSQTACWRAWGVVLESDLLQRHDRAQVEVTSEMYAGPRDENTEAHFVPNEDDRTVLNFAGIKDKKPDQPSMDARSRRLLAAEAQLMIRLAKDANFDNAADAWMNAIIPKDQVVAATPNGGTLEGGGACETSQQRCCGAPRALTFSNFLYLPPKHFVPTPPNKHQHSEDERFGLGWGGVCLSALVSTKTPPPSSGHHRQKRTG